MKNARRAPAKTRADLCVSCRQRAWACITTAGLVHRCWVCWVTARVRRRRAA